MHERLRLAREKRGFESASEAAEALGIPYGTYSGHENGSRGITRKNVARYAAFFGVSIPWLEHGIENEPKPQQVIDGDFIIVGEEPHQSPKLISPAAPKERTFKEHLAELRGDSVRLEQAIAVVEGAMLSAGLKPELLGPIRQVIQECLEEPLEQPIPEAEFAARRAMAKVALSQFLKQGAAPADKE